jgi:hypothetical protein
VRGWAEASLLEDVAARLPARAGRAVVDRLLLAARDPLLGGLLPRGATLFAMHETKAVRVRAKSSFAEA